MVIRMTVPQMLRREVEVDGTVHCLGPCTHLFITLLLINRGRIIAWNDLIEMMWPDPDNEPEQPVYALHKYLEFARAAIGAEAIKTHCGIGLEMVR